MIRGLAFLVYPVKDPAKARAFYEGQLGLRLSRQFGDQWFEYDLGDATFAIARADETHPVPVRGAVVAFEVDDLEAAVARLKAQRVRFRQDLCETPVCRLAVALDPDFNEVILHQRKT
jgi:catechol 2,3-dioxygenase-like lactoylglutathione lyase family enzyme